jgi:pilus assembly protein CpaC
MKMFRDSVRLFAIRAMILMIAAISLAGGAAQVMASKSDPEPIAASSADVPTVTLVQGMAKVVNVKGDVVDLMVANPSIVDVTALQSHKLYMVGTNLGSTNVMALDQQGNVISQFNVQVTLDEKPIIGLVKKLFPDESIQIDVFTDQAILSGHVSSPDVANNIRDVVGHYFGELQGLKGKPDEIIMNMMTVDGEQQVTLRVKVVEASRDVMRELGIETGYTQNTGIGNFTGSLASLVGLGTTPLGVADVLYNTGDSGLGPIEVAVSALENKGLINTLAEPNLTAISGEQAGFLAGGEYPVPTSIDQNGNVVYTYRPFGVALNFRPTVLSSDRISLQLQTEVSDVSPISGSDVPSFTVRRASTTVEMASGGSLMIAGLLQSDASQDLSHLPGIGDIPILGKLASSDTFQRNESELVVIVTAVLVKPYADQKAAAEENTVQEAGPLAKAFEKNIRKTYASLALDDELFGKDGGAYGYLLQ